MTSDCISYSKHFVSFVDEHLHGVPPTRRSRQSLLDGRAPLVPRRRPRRPARARPPHPPRRVRRRKRPLARLIARGVALCPAPPPPPPPPPRPTPLLDAFPSGVLRARGFLSPADLTSLYDATLIAGWEHRQVCASAHHGADATYAAAAGKPHIVLHYNYYAPPAKEQPAPERALRLAARVWRRVKQMAKPAPPFILPPTGSPLPPLPRARSPTFHSVLAIGYRRGDAFSWHNDLAGDDGWTCSISLGAAALFEYLPRESATIPSAAQRARERQSLLPVGVEVLSGDCLFFQGGHLPHRIARCADEPPAHFARMAEGTGLVRLNVQVRPYGASQAAA
ncbi:hypothetical protein AB1Y20_016564 [Prymnesium parvum]|uniref:Alpha-ketoglutarate-dependent dioxygenase AlkB-like domain-containing protein n=1 Tax=Prymnesium parvum TaxID=97485 RepID=A0AB34IAE9_PRYPA